MFNVTMRFKYLNMDLLVELRAISKSNSCNKTCYFQVFKHVLGSCVQHKQCICLWMETTNVSKVYLDNDDARLKAKSSEIKFGSKLS